MPLDRSSMDHTAFKYEAIESQTQLPPSEKKSESLESKVNDVSIQSLHKYNTKEENIIGSSPSNDSYISEFDDIQRTKDNESTALLVDDYVTEKVNESQDAEKAQMVKSEAQIDENGYIYPLKGLTQEERNYLVKNGKYVLILTNDRVVYTTKQQARIKGPFYIIDRDTGEKRLVNPEKMIVMSQERFDKFYTSYQQHLLSQAAPQKPREEEKKIDLSDNESANRPRGPPKAPPTPKKIAANPKDSEENQPSIKESLRAKTIKIITTKSIENAQEKEREENIQRMAETLKEETLKEEIRSDELNVENKHSYRILSEKNAELSNYDELNGISDEQEIEDHTDGIEIKKKLFKRSDTNIQPTRANRYQLSERYQYITNPTGDAKTLADIAKQRL